MKKVISLLVLVVLMQGCLLVPKDCTVSIISYDLNKTYSFDWDYDEVMEHIETLELNKPDVQVSDEVYNLGYCDFSFKYNDNKRCIEITGQQIEGCRIWGNTNPIKIHCSERKYKKMLKKIDGQTEYKNKRLKLLIEKL